ncbi:hypothetical protein J4450_05435 [Candidatus Micrarchaeota archaeon]|nr:hypothetical protein [Candidatus Micrarchaeota archaeon]
MAIIERTPSGVPGFDKLIEGGFPMGNTILLSGSCGTGKSIFGMQFVYSGAKTYSEPGVYITLEQKPEDVIKVMKNFGWDVDNLLKNKKLIVTKPKKDSYEALKECIFSSINEIKAKRLVVDSLVLLGMYFKDEIENRKGIRDLHLYIRELNCTTLAVSDIKERSELYSVSGLSEFIVDGVVVLRIISKETGGGHTRALFVRKMRGTDHSLDIFPMKIGNTGVEVFPNLRIFEQEYHQ